MQRMGRLTRSTAIDEVERAKTDVQIRNYRITVVLYRAITWELKDA